MFLKYEQSNSKELPLKVRLAEGLTPRCHSCGDDHLLVSDSTARSRSRVHICVIFLPWTQTMVWSATGMWNE